jgi:hypothetical protein
MSYRTLGNISTFSTIDVEDLQVKDLLVTGTSEISNVVLDSAIINGGTVEMGNTNSDDIIDLGFFARYNDGIYNNKYTGILRDASDPYKKWRFFSNTINRPTNVNDFSTSSIDSIQIDRSFHNDGTPVLPSVTFDNSTSTGMYSSIPNSIEFAVNGIKSMSIDPNKNILIGTTSLAISATNGFLYIPTMPGVPSGIPSVVSGLSPCVFDTTNNKLYYYNSGWQDVSGVSSTNEIQEVTTDTSTTKVMTVGNSSRVNTFSNINPVSVTLPLGAPQGIVFTIVNLNLGDVQITRNGSDTIDNSTNTNITLTQYQRTTIQYLNTIWFIL